MPASFELHLRPLTFSRICRGNITMWNDAAIVADNPGYTMPAQLIQPLVRGGASSINTIFSHAMNTVDPLFGELIGVGYTLNWTAFNFTVPCIIGTDALSTAVYPEIIPYSIAYVTSEAADEVSAPLGGMINAAGSKVQLSANSITIAATEKGVSSDITTYNDFSNALGATAYPIDDPVMLMYNTNQARTTCEAKQDALNFINWFATSASVAALTTTVSILPSVIMIVAAYQPITMYCNSWKQWLVQGH